MGAAVAGLNAGPLTRYQDGARFWAKVLHGALVSCWEWNGARTQDGYGRVGRGRRVVTTHRKAWELIFGPIPGGLHVLHRCDNPPCCNPTHLWLGTNADNVRDKMLKGRHVPAPIRRGHESNQAKLTPEDVIAIRAAPPQGRAALSALALRYLVSEATISRVARSKTYRNVP